MAHTSARWDAGSQIIITRVLAAPNHHAVLGIRPNGNRWVDRREEADGGASGPNKAPGAEDAFKRVNEAYNSRCPPRCGGAAAAGEASAVAGEASTGASTAAGADHAVALDIAVLQGVNVGDKMQVTTPIGKFEFVVPANAAAGSR